MSEPHIDPSGSTQQFRAFAQQNDQEAAKPQRSFVVPIIAVAILVITAVVVYLVVS